MSKAPAAGDGRAARSARTRESIVEAMLALIEGGDLQPTAARIAAEAAVSERLIYHHFDDLEALLDAVASRQTERILARIAPIDPARPLPDRIEALVAQRSALLEWITPMRRAAVLQEPFSPTLRAHRDRANEAGRHHIAAVFAPELAAYAGRDRRDLVAGLDSALSWAAWDHLRSQPMSVSRARRVVRQMLDALLNA